MSKPEQIHIQRYMTEEELERQIKTRERRGEINKNIGFLTIIYKFSSLVIFIYYKHSSKDKIEYDTTYNFEGKNRIFAEKDEKTW